MHTTSYNFFLYMMLQVERHQPKTTMRSVRWPFFSGAESEQQVGPATRSMGPHRAGSDEPRTIQGTVDESGADDLWGWSAVTGDERSR